jgi:hypothetical protein
MCSLETQDEYFLKQEELKPKTNLMNILKEKRNKILFFCENLEEVTQLIN